MEIPLKYDKKRVVIVGAGFAGLTLAKELSPEFFQVILIDKNNYHQFQPLFYQVATSGVEPSSISFPLRKIFQRKKNVYIRMAEVTAISVESKTIQTNIGDLNYDFLVLAQGAESNYFGNRPLQANANSMKSVSEALLLRNTLLQNYEEALSATNEEQRAAYMNVVIVGGGPTGAELAGAIAEMKNRILPRDYSELNFRSMQIYLIEGTPGLLNGMSEKAGAAAIKYLAGLGVDVLTNTLVKDYDGTTVRLSNGKSIQSRCLIWAAGIKGTLIPGLPANTAGANNRILVNRYNQVLSLEGVYAIGDIAQMKTDLWLKGHPQVAPVAIQQAKRLAKNLRNLVVGRKLQPFIYQDKGTMATIGKNKAVAEIGKLKIKGFLAWLIWMAVHLMSIIGVKNRLFILINWIWQYVTYDQSLRLIIKPVSKNKRADKDEKTVFPISISKQLTGV
ncbi:MAG: NAD(P)/FAD-dependent oxidoreductase [Bacteroidetes bacterium]|nr:NAD(P)/FAD-dependent oxidoreductase [Bacteroidota bacterium]